MKGSCHRAARAGLMRDEVRRQRLRVALLLDALDEVVEGDTPLFIARPTATHGHRAGRGFLVADDEHVVGSAVLRLLDAVAQIPGLRVEMNAEAAAAKLCGDLPRVLERRFAYRDHSDLLPREPEREVPGVVLDETADESLEAAEEHAVDHHGALALTLIVDVGDVEALGQVQVDLLGR